MAKTRHDRPALNGLQLLDLVHKKKVKVAFVDAQSPTMILLEPCRITQHWLKKVVGKLRMVSGRTYLRKGIFLAPIWQDVADEEIEYFKTHKIELSSVGIFRFQENYARLTYMQIEDLSHAVRQPLHVLDQYFETKRQYPTEMTAIYGELLKIGRITMITSHRYVKIRAFYGRFRENLENNKKTLEAVLFNHHLSRFRHRDSDITKLRELIDYCKAIKSRPMYRRLWYASRSLKLAIKYLREGNWPRAESRMLSALKNFEYPTD